MREEDKVLLLSEIMGADMSPYVYKYIEELRCSDVYLKLCENVGKARNVHSFKAQRLIDEFELIDFNKIITLQDFFKVSAKVNYLLDNSEAENYINPFFYNEESDLIDTVGQIAIDFDNRRFTLNDIVLDERYTTRYKVDYIKECYLEWRKEIKEMLISPLQSIVIEPQVVADKKLFDDTFITYFIICIVFNIGFIFAPFVPSQFILSIYDGSCHILVTILFSIINVLLFLIDIYFIVVMNYRLNKTRIYRKAKYTIKNSEKILNKINKKCESPAI